MLEAGVRTIYLRADKKYMLHSLSNSYEEEAPNCELKYLLMSRQKRFNVVDQVVSKNSQEIASIFVKKVQRILNGFVLKLSNNMVQLILDDRNYVIYLGKAWELSASKEKELNVAKLLRGELKGNKEHLKILGRIVKEIEDRADSSKESREDSTIKQ